MYSQHYFPENKKYWLDSGIGITNQIDDKANIALNISLNYLQDNSLYKLRFLGISELNIFGQSESNATIRVLIGKHSSRNYTQISFLGGIGINFNRELTTNVTGSTGTGWFPSYIYEVIRSVSISIPLEIEFFFKPVNFYGLGASLFADINSKQSYFGIMLKTGFGKVR